MENKFRLHWEVLLILAFFILLQTNFTDFFFAFFTAGALALPGTKLFSAPGLMVLELFVPELFAPELFVPGLFTPELFPPGSVVPGSVVTIIPIYI